MPHGAIAVLAWSPAVLYGHGTEPRHLSLPGHDVLLALRTANVLIRLDGLAGGSALALPKAVQRDPIKGTIQHVDLILVKRGEKVTVEIPVTTTGEIAPDGLLDQQLVQISVEAEATHIPPGLEIDVEGMAIGTQITASDLKLPRGVTLATEPDILVLHVIAAPTAAQLQADLGEVPAEAEPGTEPAPVARLASRPSPGHLRSKTAMRFGGAFDRLLGRSARAGKPDGSSVIDRQDAVMADDRWLVVGLGNPGPEYAGNRHNLGFGVVDLLASRINAGFKRDRSRVHAATGRLGGPGPSGHPVLIVKPTSFMNLSGGQVASVSNFYKIPPDRTVVVHDELDLPFGTVRLKLGGGDNGHNGLRSVTSSLGTREYYRVRVGVGRPPGRQDPADFLLRDFTAAERKELPLIIDRAADAVEALLERRPGHRPKRVPRHPITPFM